MSRFAPGLLLLGLWAAALPAQEIEEAQLRRLQATISEVKAELARTRGERGEVAAQLEITEQAIAAVREAITDTTARISAAERELTALRARADELEQRRREQQALIAEYVRSAWRDGGDSPLKLLLNQQDPARGSRMLQYYRYFSAARAERLSAYRSTLDEIKIVSTNILARRQELEREHERLAEEEARLDAEYATRQRLLDELDVRLSEQGAELTRLQQRAADIEALLEELRASIADLDVGGADTPFGELRGKLPWPVQGELTDRFGARHPLGDITWEGVTLRAPAGTEVRAVHHGRVLFADWLGGSGRLLIIDHGDGYMSLYAHNQALHKTEGDWVSGGEIIATVGNTGGQREAGLYFEIRRNGDAIDPVLWFIRR